MIRCVMARLLETVRPHSTLAAGRARMRGPDALGHSAQRLQAGRDQVDAELAVECPPVARELALDVGDGDESSPVSGFAPCAAPRRNRAPTSACRRRRGSSSITGAPQYGHTAERSSATGPPQLTQRTVDDGGAKRVDLALVERADEVLFAQELRIRREPAVTAAAAVVRESRRLVDVARQRERRRAARAGQQGGTRRARVRMRCADRAKELRSTRRASAAGSRSRRARAPGSCRTRRSSSGANGARASSSGRIDPPQPGQVSSDIARARTPASTVVRKADARSQRLLRDDAKRGLRAMHPVNFLVLASRRAFDLVHAVVVADDAAVDIGLRHRCGRAGGKTCCCEDHRSMTAS